MASTTTPEHDCFGRIFCGTPRELAHSECPAHQAEAIEDRADLPVDVRAARAMARAGHTNAARELRMTVRAYVTDGYMAQATTELGRLLLLADGVSA